MSWKFIHHLKSKPDYLQERKKVVASKKNVKKNCVVK